MEFTGASISTLCEKENGEVVITNSGVKQSRPINIVAHYHHKKSVIFTSDRNRMIQEAVRECLDSERSICHANVPANAQTIKIHISTDQDKARVIGAYFKESKLMYQKDKPNNLKLIFKFVEHTEHQHSKERSRRSTVIEQNKSIPRKTHVRPTPKYTYRNLPPDFKVILVIKATVPSPTASTLIIGRYTSKKKARKFQKVLEREVKQITIHADQKDFSSMTTLMKNIQNTITILKRHI